MADTPTPRYELPTEYIDLVTPYAGTTISRVHRLLDAQAGGIVEAVGPGVLRIPDSTSFQVTNAGGLAASLAAGRGIAMHSEFGGCVLVLDGAISLPSLPADSELYIFVAIQISEGNDSRETNIPVVSVQTSSTKDGGLMVAFIKTGASAITRIEDKRSFVFNETMERQFARNPATTVGLAFGYFGGTNGGSSPQIIPNGTLALTASVINYIEKDPSGGAPIVSLGSFTEGFDPLHQVTCGTTGITGWQDVRQSGSSGSAGGGTGGGIVGVTASGGLAATGTTTRNVSITDGGVTDAKLGNRTADPTLATPASTGTLTQLLSWITGRLKAFSGATNWYDAPAMTLAAAKTHADASAPHGGHFDVDGSKPLTGAIDFGGYAGLNITDAVNPTDVPSYGQVLSIASGFKPRIGVRTATQAALPANTRTGNTLTAAANGSINTAGVGGLTDIAIGDDILVKDESTGANQGVFQVDTVGSAGVPWAMTRRADFDEATAGKVENGALFGVREGNLAGTEWYLSTTGSITVNTTALRFDQRAGVGGEVNTASNLGTGDGLIFKIKAGVNFAFRSIKAGSARLGITNNTDDVTLDVVESALDMANMGGAPLVPNGGTGVTAATLGGLLYGSGANTRAELPGQTTTGRKWLRQTGTGSASAAPAWDVLLGADLPLMGASGPSHAAGAVPDPGATAGTTKYLREDGTWATVAATSATIASQAEAEAGTENTKTMTALRWWQAFAKALTQAHTWTAKQTIDVTGSDTAIEAYSPDGTAVQGTTETWIGVDAQATSGLPVRAMRVDGTASGLSVVTTFVKRTLGTPANGLGARLLMYLQTSTTLDQEAGGIDVAWTDVTHATRTSRMRLWTVLSGVRTFVFDLAPGGLALLGVPTAPTATAGTGGTQIATCGYADAAVAAAVVGLWDPKGATDCSANPNYPAALKGDQYFVSVAGKIGGASGTVVEAGDVFVAIADNAGGTQASVGASWLVLQANLINAIISGSAAGGDLSGTYPNPSLVASGVTADTYGDATHIPQITVDAKGRVTAVTEVAVSGGGGGGASAFTDLTDAPASYSGQTGLFPAVNTGETALEFIDGRTILDHIVTSSGEVLVSGGEVVYS